MKHLESSRIRLYQRRKSHRRWQVAPGFVLYTPLPHCFADQTMNIQSTSTSSTSTSSVALSSRSTETRPFVPERLTPDDGHTRATETIRGEKKLLFHYSHGQRFWIHDNYVDVANSHMKCIRRYGVAGGEIFNDLSLLIESGCRYTEIGWITIGGNEASGLTLEFTYRFYDIDKGSWFRGSRYMFEQYQVGRNHSFDNRLQGDYRTVPEDRSFIALSPDEFVMGVRAHLKRNLLHGITLITNERTFHYGGKSEGDDLVEMIADPTMEVVALCGTTFSSRLYTNLNSSVGLFFRPRILTSGTEGRGSRHRAGTFAPTLQNRSSVLRSSNDMSLDTLAERSGATTKMNETLCTFSVEVSAVQRVFPAMIESLVGRAISLGKKSLVGRAISLGKDLRRNVSSLDTMFPTELDVVFGYAAKNHNGINQDFFIQWKEANLNKYLECERGEKRGFCETIVNSVMVNGGRFFEQNRESKEWVQLRGDPLLTKITSAFRDLKAKRDRYVSRNRGN